MTFPKRKASSTTQKAKEGKGIRRDKQTQVKTYNAASSNFMDSNPFNSISNVAYNNNISNNNLTNSITIPNHEKYKFKKEKRKPKEGPWDPLPVKGLILEPPPKSTLTHLLTRDLILTTPIPVIYTSPDSFSFNVEWTNKVRSRPRPGMLP